MKTAKLNGKVYEVKETGKTIHTKAKSYTDLNGYEIDKQPTSREQLGMYEDGKLVHTIASDGKSIFHNGSKHAEVFIKDIQ